MNEFENDPNETSNDIPHSAAGFLASFLFFAVIFGIGSAISFLN